MTHQYFCNGENITAKIELCKGCDALVIDHMACNDLRGFIGPADKCPRGKWEVKGNKLSQEDNL